MKSLLLSLALCALPGCAVYEPYPSPYADPNVVYPGTVVQYDPAYVYAYPPPVYAYPYYGAYGSPFFWFSAHDRCCSRGHVHRGHSRHEHSHGGHSHGGHSRGGHSRH